VFEYQVLLPDFPDICVLAAERYAIHMGLSVELEGLQETGSMPWTLYEKQNLNSLERTKHQYLAVS
jgi:hypothetical protein